jgi:hypothetical protein
MDQESRSKNPRLENPNRTANWKPIPHPPIRFEEAMKHVLKETPPQEAPLRRVWGKSLPCG